MCCVGTETRRCHFVKSAALVDLLLLTLWQCACSLQRRRFFPERELVTLSAVAEIIFDSPELLVSLNAQDGGRV